MMNITIEFIYNFFKSRIITIQLLFKLHVFTMLLLYIYIIIKIQSYHHKLI